MTSRPARAAAFRANRWFALVWIIPAALAFLALVVLAARGIRSSDAGVSFIAQFPGTSALPATAPAGFPAWVNWQHGLNAFFLLFIIRSGWQVRSRKRPAAFWVRRNDGVLRTRKPPVRIGLNLWLHLSVDTLWVLNGIVFYVLIFCTGQWMRLVPLRFDIFPNAVSAALQYASLDWPVANGWANYNALQTLSYFLVVFIAAPLALVTGLRLSPGLAARFRSIDRVFPLRVARGIHFWVMVFFVAFVIVHVTLVLATGALRNLDHMYAARDDGSWLGFWIFAASVVVMIVAWIAARPLLLKRVAATTGNVIG